MNTEKRNRFGSIKLWSILCFVTISFFGCKNDLDIFTNDTEYMVVYGFLDAGRNTQVIRISKVFLNPDQSVEEVANNPDSIYYDNLEVYVTEFPSRRRIVFNKTDTIPKDQGFFSNEKHILYVSNEPLATDQNITYQLHIENPKTGYIVRGSTSIIKEPGILSPVSPFSNDVSFDRVVQFFQMKFTTYENAAAFEAYFDFDIIEFPQSDTSNKTTQTITWRFYSENINSPANQQIIKNIPNEGFFQFLAASLEPKPGIMRKFGNINLRHYSGTLDLKDFLEASRPSIGIVQKQTDYTNIENANGVFSSIFSFERTGLSLSESTVFHVRNYEKTKNLNFQLP